MLHFTSVAQHAMASFVARAAAHLPSQLVGGPVTGFVQLSEVGFERLGKATAGRTRARRAAPAPARRRPLRRWGWRRAGGRSRTGERAHLLLRGSHQADELGEAATEAARAAATLCAERGIVALPTTQVWRGGELGEVSAAGARRRWSGSAAPSTAAAWPREMSASDRNVGTGLPSADAVDDIDFTGGGRARAAPPSAKGRDRSARSSDGTDKPGDYMNPKGNDTPGGGKGFRPGPDGPSPGY